MPTRCCQVIPYAMTSKNELCKGGSWSFVGSHSRLLYALRPKFHYCTKPTLEKVKR